MQVKPKGLAAVAAKFQHAVGLQRQGLHMQAEALYKDVLRAQPKHPGALHLLGLIALRRGDLQTGADLITASTRIDPNQPTAHATLGNALLELRRPDDALASYDRALRLRPDDVEALYNRGNALCELERPQDALDSYDRALHFNPNIPMALNNRGNVLRALKRPEEALTSYERALELDPHYVEAFNNRGNALRDLKRPEQALSSFERALALRPGYAAAWNNRGNALLNLKRPEEALASFEHALALDPDHIESLNNRGNALLGLHRAQEALASYQQALRLKPDDVATLTNVGGALLDLKRAQEALASLDRALQLRPEFAEALNNHGNALRELKRPEEAGSSYARLVEVMPDYDYALGAMFHSQLQCCDWTQYRNAADRIVELVSQGRRADMPFSFLAVPGPAQAQLECARIFAADNYPPSPVAESNGHRYQHDKIRLGYLSADFHDHATAYLMAELFERHDPQRFETIGISFGPDDQGEMRARLQRSFSRFLDVRTKSDREVAHLMRELEVDIAVDLKGFTHDCRTGILAQRAAPIQVNYLGYPGTMGAEYIDYIVADRCIIPEQEREHYAEKVVYLPDSYQVNDSKRPIAERTPARSQVMLPEEGFVFCCFNSSYKITPDVFEVWMRLLSKVEGSVLWLFTSNATASRNLRSEATTRGIDPDRLIFAPHMRPDAHLARHRLADLFLDTLPYNAHTTASDALWAGLPVLTCRGSTFAGRVAASLLNAVGLPELATQTLQEYEHRALELATTPTLLAGFRAKLAVTRTTHALFDTDRFRRHLESAYITMWEKHQCGEPPASFAVQTSR